MRIELDADRAARRPFRSSLDQIIGHPYRTSRSLTTRGPPSSRVTTSPDDQALYSLAVVRSVVPRYSQRTLRKQFLPLLPATQTAKPAGLLPYPRDTIHGTAILRGPRAFPTTGLPHELDDPLPAPYNSMRRLAHRVPRKEASRWPRLKDGDPLPRAADGRPDFEKICIRFDDCASASNQISSEPECFTQCSQSFTTLPLEALRPCSGHPRSLLLAHEKDVDGRDRPGHDSWNLVQMSKASQIEI